MVGGSGCFLALGTGTNSSWFTLHLQDQVKEEGGILGKMRQGGGLVVERLKWALRSGWKARDITECRQFLPRLCAYLGLGMISQKVKTGHCTEV